MSSLRHFFKHVISTFPLQIPKNTNFPLTPYLLLSTSHYKPTSFITKLSTSNNYFSSLASFDTTLPDPFTSPYLSVRILCRKDIVEELSEALLCFGASSTSVDEQDIEEVCITSIYPEYHDVDKSILQAADSIGLNEVPSYEIEVGEQCDWIKKTQESFHPLQVIEGVWIVPEWRTPPDAEATNIILNPGLAFGTGEHPTTKLCLLLLHNLIKGGELFLDYGTGSGVLAIAAIKFGASLSVGIDIDPQAITSARQNAALNNIEPKKMQFFLVPHKTSPSHGMQVISETEKYDVVIANILLNPLVELADHIVSWAKPGAVIGLSGILSEQIPSIMGRYSEFLENISVTEIEDWACVSGTKKRNSNG